MGDQLEWSPKQAVVAFGGDLNQLIGIEARVGTGLSDDSVQFAGQDVSVSSESFFGGFARLRFAKNDYFRPYFLIGYTDGSGTIQSATVKRELSWSQPSYGAGFEFSFLGKGNMMTTIEWIQYYSEESLTIDRSLTALNVGLTFYFGAEYENNNSKRDFRRF